MWRNLGKHDQVIPTTKGINSYQSSATPSKSIVRSWNWYMCRRANTLETTTSMCENVFQTREAICYLRSCAFPLNDFTWDGDWPAEFSADSWWRDYRKGLPSRLRTPHLIMECACNNANASHYADWRYLYIWFSGVCTVYAYKSLNKSSLWFQASTLDKRGPSQACDDTQKKIDRHSPNSRTAASISLNSHIAAHISLHGRLRSTPSPWEINGREFSIAAFRYNDYACKYPLCSVLDVYYVVARGMYMSNCHLDSTWPRVQVGCAFSLSGPSEYGIFGWSLGDGLSL